MEHVEQEGRHVGLPLRFGGTITHLS